MKYLAPIPKQFVDQNGLPLSDGKVHVYISGDTQYANVYQDADGNELMPNPVPLDSNGAWVGFVTAGVPLDYVVEDKDGNVQFEYEKVVAGSGTANVAIEPTLTSGTKIAECWVDGELLELFAPDAANLIFVAGGSSGGGTITKTITLPHKYKNAFGGFISFVVKSSSSGLTRTVNWEYTVAGSGISYEVGKGQTIVVNYEAKVTMPFIVSSGVPFDQIVIKFTGTSADTSIYDADVYFYAEEVVEP